MKIICSLVFLCSYCHGLVVSTFSIHRIPNKISIVDVYDRTYKSKQLQSVARSGDFSSNRKLKPFQLFGNVTKSLINGWNTIIDRVKANPYQHLTIPITAALVGYVTNYVGVSMLFYPIQWQGIPIRRWPNQPLGLIGWQGIVPAKRFQMARKLVDVTISRLLSIPEVFSRLEPIAMATILSKCLTKYIYNGNVPLPFLNVIMKNICKDVVQNIEKIVNVPSLVVTGLTSDPTVLGGFFQRVGSKELSFLVESGTYFGFVLGLLQMVQWAVYPADWTLPVSGAVVGYVTNWIALKYIFEPLVPTKVGPFLLQGLFLRRQPEVSKEFCSYISANVLNSQEIWKSLFNSPLSRKQFVDIVRNNAPFLSAAGVASVVQELQRQLLQVAEHPLHVYINTKIALRTTLEARMKRLSPAEFEQVLHPVFQEDELTLIIAGGVLGMLAGALQLGINKLVEGRQHAKKEKEAMNLPPIMRIIEPPNELSDSIITEDKSECTEGKHSS